MYISVRRLKESASILKSCYQDPLEVRGKYKKWVFKRRFKKSKNNDGR